MTAQPKVFISYRREDDGGYARGVRDGVAERFGSDSVFMDLKIGPGEDFVERITEAVAGCAVLLVLMGPRWATVVKNGRPRIEDPKDFVRLEVEPALYNPEVTVIPLLVGRASMPEPDELPAQLRPLARRQAHELTNERWDYDIELLNRWLEERCGLEPVAPAPTSTPTPAPTPTPTRVPRLLPVPRPHPPRSHRACSS